MIMGQLKLGEHQAKCGALQSGVDDEIDLHNSRFVKPFLGQILYVSPGPGHPFHEQVCLLYFLRPL